MEHQVQVVYILALFVISITMLITNSRFPSFVRVLVSIAITLVATLIVFAFGSHKCLNGQPDYQTAYFCLCFLAVSLFASKNKIGKSMLIVLFLIGIGTNSQYARIVHNDDLTGNPAYAIESNKSHNERVLKSIKEMIIMEQEIVKTKQVYKEGWFESLTLPQGFSNDYYDGMKKLKLIEIEPFWHSFFTRLYKVKAIKAGIWYPGGNISKAIDKIEVREK